jgi:hypothetical protein
MRQKFTIIEIDATFPNVRIILNRKNDQSGLGKGLVIGEI